LKLQVANEYDIIAKNNSRIIYISRQNVEMELEVATGRAISGRKRAGGIRPFAI